MQEAGQEKSFTRCKLFLVYGNRHAKNLPSAGAGEGCQMLRKLYRWWLVSWPVAVVHGLSRRLHDAFHREYDLFGEFNDAGAKSRLE